MPVNKAIAIMSCPRLGFTDFAAYSMAALGNCGVPLQLLQGVYWGHHMQRGFKMAIAEDYEYVITCDYDTIFTEDNVNTLLSLMDEHPEADAICSMQVGRAGTNYLLGYTDTGEVSRKELLENDLVKFRTGHFGLSIFRVSSIKEVPKPWFYGHPDKDGEWDTDYKSGKLDDDVSFWLKWEEAGKNMFFAPRVVVGHLELMMGFPDQFLNPTYSTMKNYIEFGPPGDAWK
jgi:hypothetical protein